MSDAPNQPSDEAAPDQPNEQDHHTEPPATTADGTPEPMVSDPAKLIRLGTMVQTLMNEVRDIPTDEGGRKLLARIHAETMEELGTVLSSDLMEELSEFAACCDDEGIPTASELRVAQAQLVGWLQGLLQGLQASMVAQQTAAARQLQELQAARVAGTATTGQRMPQQSGTYL